MPRFEVPVFSPASARAAISAGADRIEINRAGSYPQGGLTPDLETEVKPLSGEDSPIPLRIMIRPRGAPADGTPDFVYSDAELTEMRLAIRRFKDSGVMRAERGDGFVFGVLKPRAGRREVPAGGSSRVVVDVGTNTELVELARPFPCVFHRAFDDALGHGGEAAVRETIMAIAQCGFDAVLTSGGPGSAADNMARLVLVVQLAGRPLAPFDVIVGGGVRSSNVVALRDRLYLEAYRESRVWFHSSCLTTVAETAGSGEGVDEEEVERIVGELNGVTPLKDRPEVNR